MPLNRKPCESYYENYQQRRNSFPSHTKTWRAEFIPSWPNLTEIENFSSSINSFSNSSSSKPQSLAAYARIWDHFINLCGKWTWKRNSPYGWELSFGGKNVISFLESICKGNLHYSISFYWPCKQALKQFVLSYTFTLNRTSCEMLLFKQGTMGSKTNTKQGWMWQ